VQNNWWGRPLLPEILSQSDSVGAKFEQYAAITPKRYEIGCQLLLIKNSKSHTGFRLVPTSMTLNDLERRNSPYFALSCKAFIGLTNRAKMIGGGDPLYLKFWIKVTALVRNRRFSIYCRL